jgi:hypothetical protein
MSLREGKDYYIEKGKYVFTSHYLKQRGYCCDCGCRHCPYKSENLVKSNQSDIQKKNTIQNNG